MEKKLLHLSIILLQFSFYEAQDRVQAQIDQRNAIPDINLQEKKTFFRKEWVKKSTAPLLLFTISAATWGEREHVREMRNRYIPTFKVGYDDYLQYAPAAAVYGLKLAGAKGRNNIGRATLSYAASIAIMGILVNSIKYTAKVERPDDSNKNSFPSGHASMAFTNASFLHKEYGLVNPVYSIGGYSVATITGLGRNLNNKHWISDVLAGAGIGLISTELGYFFIDKIYKNKGDNLSLLSDIDGNENPSFLSIKIGSALAITNLLKESELDTKKEVGFEAGLEGAYFFSKKWGIGADLSFSSFPIKPKLFEVDDVYGEYDIVTQSVGFLYFGIGPYFSHELTDKWQLVLKAIAGYSTAANGKVFIKNENIILPNNEFLVAEYKTSNSFRWNSGASITYKFNKEVGITAYIDYNQIRPKISYQLSEALRDLGADQDFYNKEKANYFTIGFKLTAYF